MHMLASVQVFHPLGKKSERKTGVSSSRAPLNFSSNKDPRTGPDTTSLLDMPREGQSLDKIPGKIQRPGSSAHKRCPSLSLDELPPHGKVKLVPLPFPVLDKPQTKPVSRKLLSLASRRPNVAYPVRPHSHSAQPPTLKPSQPAPASTSLMASDKPALPNGTSATRANITKPIQSCTGPQPSVPVLRNATPSAGSVCNFYGVCTPAVSSAWLLSSDSSTCCQQLTDSACLYQRAGTTMLTKPTDQNQISTSTFFYPMVERETTLGLTPSEQTLCLLQNPDLSNACTQDAHMTTAPVSGDRSLTALMHSPSEFLALPPAPSLEKTQKNNADEMNAEQSTPLDSYERTKCNQDASPLPLAHPGMQQPLNYSDVGSLRQKLASQNVTLGNNGLGLEDPEALQSVMESSNDFTDMTTLVADIHLPQLLNSITDLDQMEDHTASQTKDSKDIRRDQAQSRTSIFNGQSELDIKESQKVSDVFHGALQARTHHEDMLKEDDPGTIDNMANHVQSKSQIFVPKRPSVARAQGKEKAKETRENSSKKTEELKPLSHRVKAEEKPAIPKTKRKRNPPELSHDSFKKPRTHLGMHMLASVQVFHPLGKKSERKTGVSSSRALLNFSSNKDPRTGPDTTSLLDMPREGQSLDKSPGKIQRPGSSAHKRCPSLSLDELPPHGKVKLVPLPFPVLDKPQTKPVSRKLLSLASRRPNVAYPVRPHSHSAQPPTLKPSQPAPASTSLMASDKPALPNGTSATRANITKPIQSCTGPQPAASLPAPYRASSHTSLHREPLSAASNKALSSPKAKIQYLLLDFSCQPIPWRKVDIPGPVISQPITEEQRPEREAMKRQAQQERENAAKCTSLGKPQLFLQREKDMEISRYYGYAGVGEGGVPGTDTSGQTVHQLQSTILLVFHPAFTDEDATC
ncbi:uncharacterized protein C2orf78 homolog [Microtus pennsylvanicus]|uniref:uncharacterized protein C2orf78 homolog n=1 Tax=Microtus pennsylvanicus TaxID=10058 RepID=UPI003F6A6737